MHVRPICRHTKLAPIKNWLADVRTIWIEPLGPPWNVYPQYLPGRCRNLDHHRSSVGLSPSSRPTAVSERIVSLSWFIKLCIFILQLLGKRLCRGRHFTASLTFRDLKFTTLRNFNSVHFSFHFRFFFKVFLALYSQSTIYLLKNDK